MPRTRFAPALGSLWLATGFIAIRVFWRLVSDGPSWGAVASATVAALPYCVVFVACGVLASLIDVRRLPLRLTRLRLGRSIATALAVGLEAVSDLAETSRAARHAHLLRGSRSRIRALTPVLEHAIERATALAAALEHRGYGSNRARTPQSDQIAFQNVRLWYGQQTVLSDVQLTLTPGITVLTGPTGGGKTSLLDCITGAASQLNGGVIDGRISICGIDRSAPIRDTAALIGVVSQNVRLGFLGETARDELEFSSQLAGLSEPVPPGNDLRIREMSAGEVVSLALESALIGGPRVLLLDEPFADLDAAHRSDLSRRLDDLSRAGHIVVIAEHHTAELEALAPRWLTVDAHTVSEGQWVPRLERIERVPARVGTDPTVTFSNPSFRYRGSSQSSGLTETLPAGALVGLRGPNGSGKTSLLTALANPADDTIIVRGQAVNSRHPQPGLIALVPDDARAMFLCETVAEELHANDRLAEAPDGLTEATLRSLLRSTDIDAHLATHPRDLSAGTQRALAIALQLSHRPGLLLIDEPTRGLDPAARDDMAEVLRCVSETGTVTIFATHDLDWASALTHESWSMSDGAVTPARERKVTV